jgi:hypothetical protein
MSKTIENDDDVTDDDDDDDIEPIEPVRVRIASIFLA